MVYQLSFFDDPALGGLDEREKCLRMAVKNRNYHGRQLRIFAMLSTGWFPQYRILFMKNEYGVGGGTLGDHWYVDYNAGGLQVSDYRKTTYRYTWPQVLRCIEQMIDEGEYLNRDDEREIERIMQERGWLPYPRASFLYPESAWETGPKETQLMAFYDSRR